MIELKSIDCEFDSRFYNIMDAKKDRVQYMYHNNNFILSSSKSEIFFVVSAVPIKAVGSLTNEGNYINQLKAIQLKLKLSKQYKARLIFSIQHKMALFAICYNEANFFLTLLNNTSLKFNILHF